MHRVAVALLLLGMALSGCADGKDAPGQPPAGNGGSMEGDGADQTAAGMNATAEAPRWSRGRSWTWRLDSGTVAEPIEVTTLVLAATDEGYDVGTTTAGQANRAYPFHLVGLGTVDARTLAWQAHGSPVQLVRFPLVDGDRFTTDFWSAPGAEVTVVAATVTGPDGPEAGFRGTARFPGEDAVFMEADYATARGQFVRVATHFGAPGPFAQATLVGEGTADTGSSFHVTDLARWRAHADDPATLTPRDFTVGANADVLLLACFITGEGQYTATVNNQGGTTSCGGQGAQTTYRVGTTGADEGQGTVVATPGGQGSITTEVFAVDTG